MVFQSLFSWAYGFIGASSNLTTFLTAGLGFGGLTILGLVSVGGLIVYLGIAITKWLVS